MRPMKNPEPLPERRLRVRFRRLEQLDETKVALAVALIARRLVEAQQAEQTSDPSDEVAKRREVA